MAKIKKISSFQILDSRGIPTLETKVETDDGVLVSASVPSGSSTGSAEAQELRDNTKEYFGKGVKRAQDNVNRIIAPKIEGLDNKNQKEIDEKLIELDGTSNKSRLGANAILSVSLATAKSGALSSKIPLWKYLNQSFFKKIKPSLPVPFSVFICGGKHSSGNLDIQEFIAVPEGISYFTDKIKAISEIYQTLGVILKEKSGGLNIGLEGAYGPNLKTNTEAIDFILEASKKAGYGGKVKIALDVASSEIYMKEEDEYYLKSEGVTLKKSQLIGLYSEWISRYPIISIEDGLQENDWEGWSEMTGKFSGKILTIGDDLFSTNPKRIRKGIEQKSATGIIIKPNQIGTLSETAEAIILAKEAGLEYVISHRSGETCDSFISDLAVASGAKYIKAGAPSHGERVAKYNRLLEINQELK